MSQRPTYLGVNSRHKFTPITSPVPHDYENGKAGEPRWVDPFQNKYSETEIKAMLANGVIFEVIPTPQTALILITMDKYEEILRKAFRAGKAYSSAFTATEDEVSEDDWIRMYIKPYDL